MKRIAFLLLIIMLFTGCEKQKNDFAGPRRFTNDIRLNTTPVKSQGRSSLCWVYAMLATIETEHIMRGDSVHLSVDYAARTYLTEQVREKLFSRKNRMPFCLQSNNFTTRGMAGMLIDLIQNYGLQHFDAYHRKTQTNYNKLVRKLEQAIHSPLSSNPEIQMSLINELMDNEIGYAPKQVFMYGAVYTPQEFARSVCRDDEYTALTSFTHHPFNERFPLEVPDNYFHDTFLNVPLDTMMQRIERSLYGGHPVCWEGDVSERGFSFGRGFAVLDDESGKVTQEQRQEAFERHKTTDDHCMEIIGLAHDEAGNKYFLCKNSWGTNNPYRGFMYLSANYVRLKTIAVYIPR
ncbi:cysteine protease [Prevotella brunnea]|uniref:Cysteine protease n=1 Tax=Prevotella brunnea TaxID=2508867 RepID=A0A5C8GER5_9BACT|nr:C1 family peptidase [Prevotella brunnea]MDR0186294.1 cysteine protease [Prevotella brunnea]TXJ60471.1 cysteine protease [Prevotella brunnea]